MDWMRIEKLTWLKLAIAGLLILMVFRLTTAPRIICKIPCTTCSGGAMDQDFTEFAEGIKGKEVTILTQEKKVIKFNNCYALKKEFFTRRYYRTSNLNWTSLF
jgi:hypothetical protein